jgi:replicative DNA helicase
VTELTIPAAVADEQAILEEILDHPRAIRGALEARLQPEHFYFEKHAAIFRAQRQVASDGDQADEPTTWAKLQAMGLAAPAEEGVERSYLASLTGRSTNPFGVGQRARRVIDAAGERAKLEGAQRVIEGVGENEAERKAELLQSGLELITRDFAVEAEPTSRQQLGDDFFEYLEGDEPEDDLFELPFAELNECVLGGYRRKQTTVLAGWTGMGKSWLLDQLLRCFYEQGASTAIFATEMSRRERVARHITATTGVATEKLLRKKLLGPEEKSKALTALSQIPFDYFEANGWEVEQICERIVFGGYDVAAVDVVNLIPGYEQKVANANHINERLMAVALRANCHVILVSHLNRERDKGPIKPRPTPRDLRQTGMLEANAHAILFVHRDQAQDGSKEPGAEIFFQKIRNGADGGVRAVQSSRKLIFLPELSDPIADVVAGL